MIVVIWLPTARTVKPSQTWTIYRAWFPLHGYQTELTIDIFEPCITIPALRSLHFGLIYVQGSLVCALQTHENIKEVCSYRDLIQKNVSRQQLPKKVSCNSDLWKVLASFFVEKPIIREQPRSPHKRIQSYHYLMDTFYSRLFLSITLQMIFTSTKTNSTVLSAWPTSLISSESSVCQIPVKLKAKQFTPYCRPPLFL